jgi:hypothetical protein
MVDRSLPRPPGAVPHDELFTVLPDADDGDVQVLIDRDVRIMDLACALADAGMTLVYDAAKGLPVIQRADLGVARANFLRLRLRLRALSWRLP